MRLRFFSPLVLGLLVACQPPLPAPETTGTIRGIVTLDGASVSPLGVEMSLKGFTYRTTTDDTGSYQLTNVPQGTYYLRAAKAGYGTTLTLVSVSGGSTTAVSALDLSVLAVSETVTVDPVDTDGVQSWGYSTVGSGVERRVTVNYTVPSGGADVYYLLTNTSTFGYTPLAGAGPVASGRKPLRKELPGLAESAAAAYRRAQQRHDRALGGSPAPGVFAVNDKTTFTDALWDDTPTAVNRHASTLRAVTVRGTHSLYLWVADAAWDGDNNGTPAVPRTGLSHGVNQAMVDALAARFLHAGDEDDLYSWVTKLYGEEWPSSGSPQDGVLIKGGGQVHIFLSNLNPQGTADGVLMGYFHALNNFVDETGSNGKVLFALNADTLANPSDDDSSTTDTWDITDYWPAETVSTLAHEFQHMIQFYQKQVVKGLALDGELLRPTDTWINEMASLVTEDIVAERLGVPGPRGLLTLDSGTAGLVNGWLPMFNYFHEQVPLTTWGSFDLLASYANSYVFGAWLLRNYGGPELFHKIVTGAKTDFGSVLDAVNAYQSAQDPPGPTATYESLVRDWGLAAFLGTSGERAGLNFQDGSDGFLWNYNGLDFKAGSIDPWKYDYVYSDDARLSGPWTYDTSLSFSSLVSVGGGATSFHLVGHKSAGGGTQDVTLPPNMALSVVVRP